MPLFRLIGGKDTMFGRVKSDQYCAGDESSPQTPVVLNLPSQERASIEAEDFVGLPRTRSLRRRVVAAISAIVLAAVMAGSGSLGVYALAGNATGAGHRAFGGVVLTPAILSHLRSASTAKKAAAKGPVLPAQLFQQP